MEQRREGGCDKSITKSYISYNRNYQWAIGLATTQSKGEIDMQSFATHELGYSIGMNDIYSKECGGDLPPSDLRKRDLELEQ